MVVIQKRIIVMYRCGAKHTDALPFSFLDLEPLSLNDHTQALNKENATKDGKQQLFMNNNSTDTDNTSNGQRSRIAHKDLRRECVIPKEANHCSYKST